MRNQTQIFFGGLLILLGILAILSNLLRVDFGAICWPTLFILLGAWIIVRPRFTPSGARLVIRPLAEINRSGAWTVTPEEMWTFVGDTKLDFREAEVPVGETMLRVYGFIGDVDVLIPQGMGLSVSSIAFVSDTRILGQKQESFIVPVEYATQGYQEAERKIRLETMFFIMDLDID
jgi:predicted membrane protein